MISMKRIKYTTPDGEWYTQKEIAYAYGWNYDSFRNVKTYRKKLDETTSYKYKGVMIAISYDDIKLVK